MPCGKLLSETLHAFLPNSGFIHEYTNYMTYITKRKKRACLAMQCFSVLIEKCGCKCRAGCKQAALSNDFLLIR